MAVTRHGIPMRYWAFPGNAGDTSVIRSVKDDLVDENLHRKSRTAELSAAGV